MGYGPASLDSLISTFRDKGLLLSLRKISAFDSRINPIPMAALFKRQDCGRSRAEITGSNPAEGMDVSATGRYLVQRSSTECVCVSLSVIRCNSNPLPPAEGRWKGVRLRKKEKFSFGKK